MEVIQAHPRCMLVLADRHMAVLTNKRLSLKSGPTPNWSVLLSEIQNVRGETRLLPPSKHLMASCRTHACVRARRQT